MLRQQLFQSKASKRQSAQALVEFSLTAMVFLLLLVMVIEVGRLLFSYVAMQHAVRLGARYAITGQSMDLYVNDIDAGWVPGSTDPYKQIPPCEPRDADSDPPTPDSAPYYEPYRNARTCSIEHVVLDAMRGIRLDPQADPDQSEGNAYEIVVGAWEDETFIRGFGGQPSQYVVVQVRYYMPTITPLLSSIAPTIRLDGKAVMVNEAFGLPGGQSDVGLPSGGEIPPLGGPSDPDLVVTALTTSNTNPVALEPFTLSVTVQNIGQLNIDDDFDVTLYYSDTDLPSPAPDDLVAMTEIGTHTFSGLDGLASASAEFSTFFDGTLEDYYIYAWVDSGVTTGTGPPDGDIAETNEDNNTAKLPEIIEVQPSIDLYIWVFDGGPVKADPDDIITYVIRVENKSPYLDGSGSTVTYTSNGDLYDLSIFCSDCTPSVAGGDATITLDNLPTLSSVDITIQGKVEAGAMQGGVNNGASVDPPTGVVDPQNGPGSENSVNWNTPVGSLVDLMVVSVDNGTDEIVPGDVVTYVITVQHNGEDSNIVDADIVETELSIVGGSGSAYTVRWRCFSGCGSGDTSGELNTTVSMGLYDVVVLEADVAVSSNATGYVKYEVGISTTAMVSDPNPYNNVNSDTDELVPEVELEPEIIDGPSTASRDQNVTYEITVYNHGSSDVHDARLTGSLPGVTFYPNYPTGWSCTPASCDTGSSSISGSNFTIFMDIPGGDSVTVRIIGRTSKTAVGDIILNVTVYPPSGVVEIPPGTSNNSDSFTTYVEPPDPFFVNAGKLTTPNPCTSVVWGDAGLGIDPTTLWVLNRAYTSGSWGFWGNQLELIGAGTSPPPEEGLFQCLATTRGGSDFGYTFDILVPGAWRIYLAFLEPSADEPGERSFVVQAQSGSNVDYILPAGYDPVTSPDGYDLYVAAGGTDIPHVEVCEFQVKGTGRLNLVFESLTVLDSKGDPVVTNAVVSGIGLEYMGESGASDSCGP